MTTVIHISQSRAVTVPLEAGKLPERTGAALVTR